MEFSTALTWSWLNILTPKRYTALLEVFSSLDEALQELSPAMLKELGCREDTIMIAMNRFEEFDPDAYLKELERRDLLFLTIEDEAYPAQLKTIPDPPTFLYYAGNLDILNQPCLGLVGTRDITPYGKRVTETMVSVFVNAGVVTVSGLAFGIDALVAEETMRAGGKTVAVLGHGLANISPKANANIAKRIVEEGGLYLSEFPLDATADKYTFPARNRIIAGLSLGTVVLEAGEGSGALITADLALEYGRDVFAVPGQIFDPKAAGCHEIISKGQAKLITSADDVLQEVGIIASNQPSTSAGYEPQSDIEAALLGALTTMPQSVSSIVEKAAIDAAAVNATLTLLELHGVAKNVGSGMWVRN